MDDTLRDARMLVLREVGLKPDQPNDHEKLRALAKQEGGAGDLKERVRKKAKEIMIDDELRRRR